MTIPIISVLLVCLTLILGLFYFKQKSSHFHQDSFELLTLIEILSWIKKQPNLSVKKMPVLIRDFKEINHLIKVDERPFFDVYLQAIFDEPSEKIESFRVIYAKAIEKDIELMFGDKSMIVFK